MGDKGRRPWPTAAIVVIALSTLAVLYAVWRSPHRSDLATYGAFAAAVVALALGWIALAWRARTRKDNAAGELDNVANLLAVAVKDQWTQAADEQGLLAPGPIPVRWHSPSLPLASPPAAAAASRRFAPLPGLNVAGETDLGAGDIEGLFGIVGGLGSGRLIIAGAPGAGKTGAAILLMLAALDHREHAAKAKRSRIPVPVLFTVQDWNPVNQQVRDWLTRQMRRTYPIFSGKAGAAHARALIAAGKIMVIVDGLDEIAEELRPVALKALSQQGGSFRLVALTAAPPA